MRRLLLQLLAWLPLFTSAQVQISGSVADTKSKPISGVSVYIKDSYDGSTTDSLGRFSFSTTTKGAQTLIATSIGYKVVEQSLFISMEAITIQIVLKEEINELKAVVISAGSFEASDRKKATVLSSIDILTTASANADVTGAIKTLPGAQQVGESEGLFVRGGTSSETRTYMDGTLVNNFFYSSVPNIAQRGRFSPWFLKGTVFSTGGYSALYGQALSSALILETVDLPEQSAANLSLSVVGVSGGLQQLAKNKKFSWGMSYAYTDLILAFNYMKQRQHFSKMPVYHTADANFRLKTKGGIVKYYVYFSANKLGFSEKSIDTLGFDEAFHLSNTNMYHNLSWREQLGNGWKINMGVSFTKNRDDIRGLLQDETGKETVLAGLERKNFQLDSRSEYGNTKLVLEKKLSGLSAFRFGGEYNYSNEEPVISTRSGMFGKNITGHTNAGFAEADIYLTNHMAAKVGSRLEHSSLLSKTNIAPRLSLAYKLGTYSQASVAWGIFYQNPESRYLPTMYDLNFSKATHYIAQYQRMTGGHTFRTELFYKKYQGLIKTTPSPWQEMASGSRGYGDAKGLEIFWRDKKSVKGLDYWISYSYLDTKRDFINYPTALEPSFAARHTGSLVLKKFATKLKTMFNASYTYASGRPYYNIRFDEANKNFFIADRGRTIDYNSISFSMNYLPNVFKSGAGKYSVFVFSVTNVLNTKHIYGYRYSYSGHRKEAIMPPARMFFFLGAFLSFGVDRTDDVINSNL